MTSASLKSWRERLHWTKDRAAKELGLSPNGYAALEAGHFIGRPRPIRRHIALACAALAHGLPPID